jgi:hypothetical protein
VVGTSNRRHTLPRTNILLKISRPITVVEVVGIISHIPIKGQFSSHQPSVIPMLTSSGLLCKAIPQTSLLTIKTNRLVTTQINHTHNPVSRTARTAEAMAATVATASMVLTDACQVPVQMPHSADLVGVGAAPRLLNSQTYHGRQRPVLEAAALPLKRHVRNRLSRLKHLPTLHLSTLTTILFAPPRICV